MNHEEVISENCSNFYEKVSLSIRTRIIRNVIWKVLLAIAFNSILFLYSLCSKSDNSLNYFLGLLLTTPLVFISIGYLLIFINKLCIIKIKHNNNINVNVLTQFLNSKEISFTLNNETIEVLNSSTNSNASNINTKKLFVLQDDLLILCCFQPYPNLYDLLMQLRAKQKNDSCYELQYEVRKWIQKGNAQTGLKI